MVQRLNGSMAQRQEEEINLAHSLRRTVVPSYRCTVVPLYHCTIVPLYHIYYLWPFI